MRRKLLPLGILGILTIAGTAVGTIYYLNKKQKEKKNKKENDDLDDYFYEFDNNKKEYINIYSSSDSNKKQFNFDLKKDNDDISNKVETNVFEESNVDTKQNDKLNCDCSCDNICTCNEKQITLHDVYPELVPDPIANCDYDTANTPTSPNCVIEDDNIEGQLHINDVFNFEEEKVVDETIDEQMSIDDIDTAIDNTLSIAETSIPQVVEEKSSFNEMDIETKKLFLRSKKEEIVIKRVELKMALEDGDISKELYDREISNLGKMEKEINEQLSSLKKN